MAAAHFDGVTTVVTKMLNMVGPDVAYFGQKDAQQAVVVQRLVRDLDMPVRIEVCPTVRDRDGLALSSRNALLSAADRQRAAALHRALARVRQAVLAAASTTPTPRARPASPSSAPLGSSPTTSSSSTMTRSRLYTRSTARFSQSSRRRSARRG